MSSKYEANEKGEQSSRSPFSAPAARIGASAYRALAAHDWPGNVRELRQVMRLSLVVSGGSEIGASAIHDAIEQIALEREALEAAGPSADAVRLTDLLTRHNWNVASAARELGVTPKTVYSWLKREGVPLPKRRKS